MKSPMETMLPVPWDKKHNQQHDSEDGQVSIKIKSPVKKLTKEQAQACQDAYNNWGGSIKGREQELEDLCSSHDLTKEQVRRRFAYLRQIQKSKKHERSKSTEMPQMTMKALFGPTYKDPVKRRKKGLKLKTEVLSGVGDELLIGEKGGGGGGALAKAFDKHRGEKGGGEVLLEYTKYQAGGDKGEEHDAKSDSINRRPIVVSRDNDDGEEEEDKHSIVNLHSSISGHFPVSKRKTMAQLTPEQVHLLESRFQTWGGDTKGHKEELQQLAKETGLTELQVRKRFEYMRRRRANRLMDAFAGFKRLQVCVEDIESALRAKEGGAHRVEVCGNLREGGITPSIGLVSQVVHLMKRRPKTHVDVLCRPRLGDYCYSHFEFEAMKQDILAFKTVGIQGIVMGVLRQDRAIDVPRFTELCALAGPMRGHGVSITFSKAFDHCKNPYQALDQLIDMGVERVLTTVPWKDDTLKQLLQYAHGRINVVAADVTPDNVAHLIESSGVSEIYVESSVYEMVPCKYNLEDMPAYMTPQASAQKVASIIDKITEPTFGQQISGIDMTSDEGHHIKREAKSSSKDSLRFPRSPLPSPPDEEGHQEEAGQPLGAYHFGPTPSEIGEAAAAGGAEESIADDEIELLNQILAHDNVPAPLPPSPFAAQPSFHLHQHHQQQQPLPAFHRPLPYHPPHQLRMPHHHIAPCYQHQYPYPPPTGDDNVYRV